INDKTYRLAPDSRLGMSCHEAFFKNDKPCQRCPMKQVEDKINYTMEVYNPVLKVWSSADASRIHWGGKDACLLCCHDITCYKKAEENSANQ
ncbi:MAG: PAS domain S-box protein, partial [Enterocloster bolteae]